MNDDPWTSVFIFVVVGRTDTKIVSMIRKAKQQRFRENSINANTCVLCDVQSDILFGGHFLW